MDILIQIGIAVAMFAVMFHLAARQEMRKNERIGLENPRKLVLMKHFTGQIIGIAGVLVLISMAMSY